jgi:hypothetical protein
MCLLPLVGVAALIFIHQCLMSSFHTALVEDETSFEAKWTVYKGQDLPGHDAEIVNNWRNIAQLKRICRQKGYNAISIDHSRSLFGHASLKKVDFKISQEHLSTPESGDVHLYVL